MGTWSCCSQVSSRRLRTHPTTWYRTNTATILGAALTAEKKYAEAERLLIEGYQGLVARKATIPSDVNAVERAREWLVKLYQAWEKRERANEWIARASIDR